jgi:hypothetical protein
VIRSSELDPWAEALDAFPLTAEPDARLRAVVRYALLAPSSHNSQPWWFRVEGDRLELWADRARALAVCDPEDRELTISCGCALLNLRVALRNFGQRVSCQLLPDPVQPDLLVRLRLEGEQEPGPDDRDLFRAIPLRRTNRQPFESQGVPENLLARARKATEVEGVWLQTLNGESDRIALGDLIAEADRQQMADRRFRRELAAWIHANRSGSHDGMPGYAYGAGDLASTITPVVIRTFDMGKGAAARDRDLALGSPVLAILWTEEETPRAWLQAGQGLERALLRLTADGISVSFLNQPIEIPDLRDGLTRMLGREGYPQVILRLGYGRPIRPTPRRPVDEVLEG